MGLIETTYLNRTRNLKLIYSKTRTTAFWNFKSKHELFTTCIKKVFYASAIDHTKIMYQQFKTENATKMENEEFNQGLEK